MSEYEYEVIGELYNVPLLDIYCDAEFNCRGYFDIVSVHDLANSINEVGLLQPLIVQPIKDVPEYERPNPCPWTFRLICGHRRFVAIDKFTQLKTAKCEVHTGLSAQSAYALNFVENLERKDLNILQEALAIHRRWANIPATDIRKQINKDERWIRVRQYLINLPNQVQMAAASGRISQYDIESLHAIHKTTPDDVIPTLNQLIETKGKVGQTPVIATRQHWRKNRSRVKKELGEMVTFLYTHQKYTSLTERELELVTSTLAWASRGIDTKEFLVNRLDIPSECVKIDVDDRNIVIIDAD